MLTDARILRIDRFRPLDPGAAFDAAFRDDVLPALVAVPGVDAVHVGRRGSDETGERALVLPLSSAEALEALDASPAIRSLRPADRPDGVAEAAMEIAPIAFSAVLPDAPPATILRIFRGEVRDGEFDTYIREVGTGTLADMASGDGPNELYLAVRPPLGFVTVSVWSDWSTIERRTGGNIRRPIATRNSERIREGTATHYEILPAGTTTPRLTFA